MRENIEFQWQVSRNMIEPQDLTMRELEVLKLIADGYTSGEIAKKLNVVAETVYSHRKSMMEKFQVKNAAHLVAYALRNKILK